MLNSIRLIIPSIIGSVIRTRVDLMGAARISRDWDMPGPVHKRSGSVPHHPPAVNVAHLIAAAAHPCARDIPHIL
ncbi:hypothetical protein GCM10011352_10990 [Marinobacterium zhoushanense]|uniref:Uncharacterized protein n=1 Tax=Marinobacterium zhoushanense TaxID=1679163 RepID=A0ABQ1K6R9_9GAMM|nr:hypothetical protein GCM10011352_10990 [Marinobacterium zhoushanense]